MRAPVTHEALEETAALASTGATGHRQLAMQLLAWAERPHEQDEFSIADLLVSAGEHFALAQDHASALEAYTRAFESEVPTSPDARGFMIHALLDLGRTHEAEELSEQLRRSRPATAVTYHLVGETWEGAGDLDRANRWLTRGVLLAEQQGAQMEWAMLLIGRLWVRQTLGFPPDDYNEAALQILHDSNAGRLREAEDDPSPTHAVISKQRHHSVIDLF